MEFYTVSKEPRPMRLGEVTRRFAYESLQGKYGDDTMQTAYIVMDGTPGFDGMTEYEKYDAAIAKIVSEAPLRICAPELVSGAATLGGAILRHVPAAYGGQPLWYSISHLTLGFDQVLKYGLDGIKRRIDERLRSVSGGGREVILSMKRTLEAMRVWRKCYLDALKDTKPQIYARLKNVPFKPAGDFGEAVQSLWFTFAFTHLCGNWPGIGRIDELLGEYLKSDIESGKITLDEARELLAHFFIKGCEWIQSDTVPGSGDAQHTGRRRRGR